MATQRPQGGWMLWLEEFLLGPIGPAIKDLASLSYGGGDEMQTRLHELLDWRVQRAMMVAKGTVGWAASFATALFLSSFKNELHIEPTFLIVAIVVSLLTASFGVYVLRRLAVLSNDYAALIALLRLLS